MLFKKEFKKNSMEFWKKKKLKDLKENIDEKFEKTLAGKKICAIDFYWAQKVKNLNKWQLKPHLHCRINCSE